jgi:sigma-B regulation protein RsbU (phosphoserine phosphatase)
MPHRVDPPSRDWQARLAHTVETMREMSRQTDPQAMVAAYRDRVRTVIRYDHSISLSRRDMKAPSYRITRDTRWKEDINPWQDKHRLPVLAGGLLGELLYRDEPRIINDLEVDPDDPSAPYLAGHRSLAALPLYDQGVALNMVVMLRERADGFVVEELPDHVWRANLFGRAAHNLVLSSELKSAYQQLDREMQVVADIQKSLLPPELPRIATMDLAVHYDMAQWAGGDYYDFIPLPDGKWGILIADVAGHGAPAAVVMAITHALVHSNPEPPVSPRQMFDWLNRRLVERYTGGMGTFVTAFYGVYCPTTRELTYSSAGHPPLRVKRCADGSVLSLDGARNLPLGITQDTEYEETTHTLVRGDQVVFFTDGITEAFNPDGEMFGLEGVDRAVQWCRSDVNEVIKAVLEAVELHTAGRPADDDQTLLVAKIK